MTDFGKYFVEEASVDNSHLILFQLYFSSHDSDLVHTRESIYALSSLLSKIPDTSQGAKFGIANEALLGALFIPNGIGNLRKPSSPIRPRL